MPIHRSSRAGKPFLCLEFAALSRFKLLFQPWMSWLIFLPHQAYAVSAGPMRNVHGLGHVLELYIWIAFYKCHLVLALLINILEPGFQSIPWHFFLVDFQDWRLVRIYVVQLDDDRRLWRPRRVVRARLRNQRLLSHFVLRQN